MRRLSSLLAILAILATADICEAKVVKTKPVKAKAAVAKVSKTTVAKPKLQPTNAAALQRALASTGRAPKSMPSDPNRAVEIRGQSRTLSMMLVLKNGKDSINFIKIRKDYRAEIDGTQF